MKLYTNSNPSWCAVLMLHLLICDLWWASSASTMSEDNTGLDKAPMTPIHQNPKTPKPQHPYKCDNHKESNLKCGLHKESLMDQKQLSFVSCEILSPAGKYCHVIKDFIIWEHLPSFCCYKCDKLYYSKSNFEFFAPSLWHWHHPYLIVCQILTLWC